ncbi:MAG: lytic transglycosylase domain-containing protein [Gammaproteobacteria bacterium]|nr:lytic transglycosylase domain-containing protein [Gammaproteobacteria bacterium]
MKQVLLRAVQVLALALPALAAAATGGDDRAARAAFRAAWQRVAQGLADHPDPPLLRRYVIYPYLRAARLQRDLTAGDDIDARVEAFLAAHDGQPVSLQLRRAWLLELARREDWPRFVSDYRADEADAQLQCDELVARLVLAPDAGLTERIQRRFVAAAHSPQACEPAFDWLRQQHAMTADMLLARSRLALDAGDAGLALRLADALPAAAAASIREHAALVAQPQRALQRFIDQPRSAVDDAALIDGFMRLARRDPRSAERLYPQLVAARVQDAALRDSLLRALALGEAWSRLPQAVAHFAAFEPKADDDSALGWRVRAALWNGDWRLARRWLAALPQTLADRPAWTYWRGRAAGHFGDAAAARALYRRVAGADGYYALLAADRIGRPYRPQPQPLADRPALRARLLGLAGVIRARELFAVALEPQASVEWRRALAHAGADARLQAIRLARRWGWYQQAIATAAQQGVFDAYALLYPCPYADAVAAAARAAGLPRQWLYAVLRQESLYDVRAVSAAGAYGLLQLQLPTARAVAHRHHLPPPDDAEALFDPRRNLLLGALRLRELLDHDQDRLVVALAAYNAGRSAVVRWLPAQPMDADIWIENIPYNETRGYLQRMLWHLAIFGWRSSGKPQDLAALLTPVAAH